MKSKFSRSYIAIGVFFILGLWPIALLLLVYTIISPIIKEFFNESVH